MYNKITSEKKFKSFMQFYKNSQTINEKELLNEKMDEFERDLNEINDINKEIKNKIDELNNSIFEKFKHQ